MPWANQSHLEVGGAVDGLLSVPREHPLEVGLLVARAAGHLEGLDTPEPVGIGELGGRGEGPVVAVVSSSAGVRLRRNSARNAQRKK